MIIASVVCYYGLKIPFNSKEQFAVLTIYTGGVVWSLLAFNRSEREKKNLKFFFRLVLKLLL
jgi:hypothetical protein